jgi:hypothetical protein
MMSYGGVVHRRRDRKDGYPITPFSDHQLPLIVENREKKAGPASCQNRYRNSPPVLDPSWRSPNEIDHINWLDDERLPRPVHTR